MKSHHAIILFGLSIMFFTFGCEVSGTANDSVMARADVTVVARDARGGSSPQDAGQPIADMAAVADAAVVADGSGGSGGAGGEGGQGGTGGTAGAGGSGGEGGEGGEGGGGMNMPEPAQCGPGVDTCEEACRWLADCALAGACELDDTDRPLLVSMCERTCAGSEAYGEILCTHNSCEASIRFAQNDAQFAAICRGEAPPEMADPVVAQCTALNTCLGNCNRNQACVDQCYMNATPEAQQRFGDIINCVRANQCIDLANQIDQACLREQCGEELDRCFGPQAAPEGEGSCNVLLRCLNECPDGDGRCRTQCVTDTSPDSHGLYVAALNCVNEHCRAPDADANCQQINCGDEIDACVDDGRPIGPDTCSEVADCFWACRPGANLLSCRRDCNEEGTRESQNAWNEFLVCAGDAQCRDRPSCEAACQQQMAACRNAGAIEVDAGLPPMEDAGVGPADMGVAVDAAPEPEPAPDAAQVDEPAEPVEPPPEGD